MADRVDPDELSDFDLHCLQVHLSWSTGLRMLNKKE